MAETYIKVADRPCYLYRAVDEHGQVVDVYYSERRDAAAAEAFFRLGLVPGDPRLPQRPRFVRAWHKLTAQLLAA